MFFTDNILQVYYYILTINALTINILIITILTLDIPIYCFVFLAFTADLFSVTDFVFL
jgi:hypothetical protein